jgi:lysophospholipase L1-like esterase
VWDDPIEGYKNGLTYLIPCLETHRPLDLVVVMLGTNDLKRRFSLSAADIAQGAGVLIRQIQISQAGLAGRAPVALLMAPPPVVTLTDFAEMFEGSEPKSQRLSLHYTRVAQELGCPLVDTSKVIVSSQVDGIHFDPGEHAKLGRAVAQKIMELIG